MALLPVDRILPALVAYGVVNAILYASLLPLWEGFDEPFHCAYVEYLDKHHKFPVLGETTDQLTSRPGYI